MNDVLTCVRELLALGNDKSLVLDWNFFTISAAETKCVDGSLTYTFIYHNLNEQINL